MTDKIISLLDYQYDKFIKRLDVGCAEESYIIVDGVMENSFEINIECIFSGGSGNCKGCALKRNFTLTKDSPLKCYMYDLVRAIVQTNVGLNTVRFYEDNICWLKVHDHQVRILLDNIKNNCQKFIDVRKLDKDEILLKLKATCAKIQMIKSTFRKGCMVGNYDYVEEEFALKRITRRIFQRRAK